MAKKSLFYRVYFTVLAVFAVLLIVGLLVLNAWLKAYENAQPQRIVDRVIGEYLEKGNAYGLKDFCALKVSDYESEKAVNDAVKKQIGGKKLTAVSSAKKPADCDLAYAVKADDQKVLYVYLKRGGKKAMGNRGYTAFRAEFPEEWYHGKTVSLPADANVTLNGVPLKNADRKDLPLPKLDKKVFDGDITPKQTAKIGNLLGETLTVSAKKGGKALTVKEENGGYTVMQDFTEEERKQMTDFAVDAAKTCAAYMQNDASLTAVKKYVDTDTEYYENLRTSQVYFAWKHNGYHFEDVAASELHRFSGDLYCCRVRLTQVLHLGSENYKDRLDKYVYIHRTKEGLKVIDLQIPEDKK